MGFLCSHISAYGLVKERRPKRSGYKKRRLYRRVLHLQQQNQKNLSLSAPGGLPLSPVAQETEPPSVTCHLPRTAPRNSGDDRGRTGNLRLAKPALSRLSYVPEPRSPLVSRRSYLVQRGAAKMGPGRVELPTSPLSGVRSNQLSYEPDAYGVRYRSIKHPTAPIGFECRFSILLQFQKSNKKTAALCCQRSRSRDHKRFAMAV